MEELCIALRTFEQSVSEHPRLRQSISSKAIERQIQVLQGCQWGHSTNVADVGAAVDTSIATAVFSGGVTTRQLPILLLPEGLAVGLGGRVEIKLPAKLIRSSRGHQKSSCSQ